MNYDTIRWLYWRLIDGDFRHRFNMTIPDGALIIEVGGYTGDFVEQILNINRTAIIRVYEPIPRLYNAIKERFPYKNVQVINAGVGGAHDIKYFYDDGIGSFEHEQGNIKAIIHDASTVITEPVFLLNLNCEGAEYEILSRLYYSDKIKLIDNIIVSYHDKEKNNHIIKIINNKLSKTHDKVSGVLWVYDKWRRKT